MPEGPTIRNTADSLREVLLGRCVERFASSFKKAAGEEWANKLEGRSVTAVRSHGKNLFIDFEGGWTLYSHMLMWGSWHIYRQGEPWRKEQRKARAVIETADHVVVLFSAPVCELIHASQLADHRTSELGPDLLSQEFDDAHSLEIRRRFQAQPHMPIGEALMDQTVVAGIGNILKSEILFRSGIHPLRPAAGLSDAEFARLIEVSRDFMRRSYQTQGFKQVFLPPQLQEALGRLGYVYGRSKQPCLRCGTPIQLIRQGRLNRSTFFCPFCQPLDPQRPGEPATPLKSTAPWADSVRTLEDARRFVLTMGICAVRYDPKARMPTLWEAAAVDGDQANEFGWAEKMVMVWSWQRQLPWRYPDEIFYGKVRGGRAVLMSIPVLRERYAREHRPLSECSPLAQRIYALIAAGPIETQALRDVLGGGTRKERALFERALQELQVTFNIARSNKPDVQQETWVPFLAQYPEFGAREREA